MEESASRRTNEAAHRSKVFSSVLPAIPAPTLTQKTMVPPIAKLTDDLMAEVLSRLPAKPFFQFKCISKSWLAVASDPCYRSKFPHRASGLFLTAPSPGVTPHRARKNTEYISLAGADDNTIDTTLGFLPRLWNMTVIYSCNGLVLCRSWVGPSRHTHGRSPLPESYFVCNPATREWAAIPTSYGRGRVLALGFDPRLSRRYHVLNFNWKLGLEIFSSETGEWVRSQVCWTSDARKYHAPRAVFLHGIFYVTNGLNQVLGLDLEGKVHWKIELPGGGSDKKASTITTHSGGHLHYMVQGADEVDVWILKDKHHGEWLLKHRFSAKALLEETGTEYPPTNHIRYIEILELHPDLDAVFFRVKLKIFSYHLNSGKLKEVCNLKQGWLLRFVFYTPCLSNGFSDQINAS